MIVAPDRLRHLQARWERFWFEPVPAEIFAVLRVAFGVAGLVMLAGQLPTSTFWRATGIVPVPGPGGVRETIVNAGAGDLFGDLLFLWFAASLVAMVIGFNSRVAILMSFAAANTQFLWNRLQLSGANVVFNVMLFCLIWAETGATWSIDAWWTRRRQSLKPAGGVSPLAPILPLRLIQFQLALIYFNSGLSKIPDVAWRDGTALYWAMTNNVFHRFPFSLPLMNETSLATLSYVTIFFELLFPFLLLNRWTRRAAIFVGVMLHLGIWATMEVGIFSPLMLAAYIAFIDPHRVARWFHRVRAEPHPAHV